MHTAVTNAAPPSPSLKQTLIFHTVLHIESAFNWLEKAFFQGENH